LIYELTRGLLSQSENVLFVSKQKSGIFDSDQVRIDSHWCSFYLVVEAVPMLARLLNYYQLLKVALNY